jgi:hypothetical protein
MSNQGREGIGEENILGGEEGGICDLRMIIVRVGRLCCFDDFNCHDDITTKTVHHLRGMD